MQTTGLSPATLFWVVTYSLGNNRNTALVGYFYYWQNFDLWAHLDPEQFIQFFIFESNFYIWIQCFFRCCIKCIHALINLYGSWCHNSTVWTIFSIIYFFTQCLWWRLMKTMWFIVIYEDMQALCHPRNSSGFELILRGFVECIWCLHILFQAQFASRVKYTVERKISAVDEWFA